MVNGEPPRGEYAGLSGGCALELREVPSAPMAPCKPAPASRVTVQVTGPERVPSVDPGGRRVAPPLSRRLSASPRVASRRRESRLGGMWVFLSSAAASVMVLLLSTLAVTQYGTRPEEPVLTPPASPAGEEIADSPRPERPPGLAAARSKGL